MAYAGDIIEDCFTRTKELFFPIRKGYWIRMWFAGAMSGNGQGSNFNSSNYTDTGKLLFPKSMTIQEAIAAFNTQGLSFLSQYGYILGIAFLVIYFLGLILSYFSSIFTFVFIDGIIKKELSIGKSFSEYKTQGKSLFIFRFVLGLVSLFVTLGIFSPIFVAFFQNQLAYFNFWQLIPMVIAVVIYSIAVSLLTFLVDDFAVPVMYMKKCNLSTAWAEFSKIASGKKREIALYWLIKLGLGIVAGLGSLVLVLIMILPGIVVVLIGILLYFAIAYLAGKAAAIIIIAVLGFIAFVLWLYIISIILTPVPAFFRLYSIEMVKKLQERK
jgi:hypothetical protein